MSSHFSVEVVESSSSSSWVFIDNKQTKNAKRMRVITGDECGLLKECLPEQGETNGVRKINASQTMARKHGCIDLCWLQSAQDESFAALSMNGICSIWERTSDNNDDGVGFGKYRKRSEISNLFDAEAKSLIHPSTKPLRLFAMKDDDRVCACNAAGRVSIVDTSEKTIVTTFDTVKATDQDDPQKPLLTTCHVDQNRLAVGGQERDVTLWDLSTGKEVWKAKNARPDPQTLLQQQVWPSAVAFLEENVLAVGSAHAEVRVYDIRQQRRPTVVTPKGLWEHRITALCPLPNHTLVIGDSAGYLQTMDWRHNNFQHITGRFVGPAGSIRAVAVHPKERRLAVVGLDRMLRIYDYQTRKQLHCMYLRQRLNCALFGQVSSNGNGEEKDLACRGENEEGDWDQDDKVEDYVDSDDEEEPKLEGEDEMKEGGSSSEEGKGASESEQDSDHHDTPVSEDGSDSGSNTNDGSEEESSSDDDGDEDVKPSRKRAKR